MGAGILLSWAASESEPVKSSFQSIIKYACEAAYSAHPFRTREKNNGPETRFLSVLSFKNVNPATQTIRERYVTRLSLFLSRRRMKKKRKREEKILSRVWK